MNRGDWDEIISPAIPAVIFLMYMPLQFLAAVGYKHMYPNKLSYFYGGLMIGFIIAGAALYFGRETAVAIIKGIRKEKEKTNEE